MLKFIQELVGNHGTRNDESGDGVIRYSLRELNKKLIEYEKMTRVYKVEYVPD